MSERETLARFRDLAGPHEARSHNAPSLVLRCIRLMTVPLSLGSGLPGAGGGTSFCAPRLRVAQNFRTGR
jgi:hypothetical protein